MDLKCDIEYLCKKLIIGNLVIAKFVNIPYMYLLLIIVVFCNR